jgi:hypothetical protein
VGLGAALPDGPGADLGGVDGGPAQAGHVDLEVEVAGVGDHGPGRHGRQVLEGEGVAAAGDGHELLPNAGRLGHRQDLVALHHRLQGGHRVDLADHHPGAHAAGPHGQPAAAPAVADDHEHLAGEQDVGGAEDAVEGRLAGAVAVVEQVLGGGVVDG